MRLFVITDYVIIVLFFLKFCVVSYRRLALNEQRRKELYAKQGRGNQFTSREDRDRWISKELKALNKAIKDKEDQIKRLKEDLENDQKKAKQLETDIAVGTISFNKPLVWPQSVTTG